MTKFDYLGCIDDGPYAGFSVLPLAIAACDSSFDFPSFVSLLDLEHLWDDEAPMHPTVDDARRIAGAIRFRDQADEATFISEFPLTWDT